MAEEKLILRAETQAAETGLTNTAAKTGKLAESVDRLRTSYVRLRADAAAAQAGVSRVGAAGGGSAEGLGVLVSTMARLNPALAMMGEATLKQMPTLAKFADSIKTAGVAAGAATAIVVSAFSVLRTLTSRQSEYAPDDSALQQWNAFHASVWELIKTEPYLREWSDSAQKSFDEVAEARQQMQRSMNMKIVESDFTKNMVKQEQEAAAKIAELDAKRLATTAEVQDEIRKTIKELEFSDGMSKSTLDNLNRKLDALRERGKALSKEFVAITNPNDSETQARIQRAIDDDRRKAVAKIIADTEKAAAAGITDQKNVNEEIVRLMDQRKSIQGELNIGAISGQATDEKRAELQEKLNELASKENEARRKLEEKTKEQKAHLEEIAKLEKEVADKLRDMGLADDPLKLRITNARELNEETTKQRKLIADLIEASKDLNKTDEERKKINESVRAELESLNRIVERGKELQEQAEREREHRERVRDMRRKEAADLAAEAAKRGQAMQAEAVFNQRQAAELEKQIKIKARAAAEEKAERIAAEAATKAAAARAAGDDKGARQIERDANKARRNVFKDLNKGQGKETRDARAELTTKFGTEIIQGQKDRGELDAQQAAIMEQQVKDAAEQRREVERLKQRFESIQAAQQKNAVSNRAARGR